MFKSIGILGGMGPYATLRFEQRVLEAARPDAKGDQDYPTLLVINDGTIPDRTAALVGGGSSPVPQMARRFRQLVAMGAEVLCVPCNTAHAFCLEFTEATQGAVFVHIVDAVVSALERFHSAGLRRVGLMATTGTLAGHAYDRLHPRGFLLKVPDAKHQSFLMDAIYGSRGIKAGFFDEPRTILQTVAHHLRDCGAQVIVLACTDLSLVLLSLDLPIVDSTEALAQEVVRVARLQ